MRLFFNSILSAIGRESLTDEEFGSLPEALQQAYTQESYNALKAILLRRGNADNSIRKLQGYYTAKGFSATGTVASSNIFVGSPL